MKHFIHYIRLLRINHWIKNLFLFLPLFFAQRFFESHLLIETLCGFISFCLMSSSVYVLNDFADKEEDRNHPKKKTRPLASAAVSDSGAYLISIVCCVASILISFFISKTFLIFLLCYALINGLYTSMRLKQIPVIDVLLIAAGFVLRVEAGAAIGDIPVSAWLNVITFLLALFLALAKRREDVLLLNQYGMRTRKGVTVYNLKMLDITTGILATIIFCCYLFYSLSEETILRFGNDKIYLSSVFVLAGILRYLFLIFIGKKSGEPVEILWKDFFLQATLIFWIAFLFLIIYLN